jgi:quinol monooxygenase YgiN
MSEGVVTLSAVIRAREGKEALVEAALVEVVRWVEAQEPQTLAYHVGRDSDDPTVFTTFERFADKAALESHNASPALDRFSKAVADSLAVPVEIRICLEIAVAAAR